MVKKYFYSLIVIVLILALAFFMVFKGGITGNPIKIYSIENFPGIYVDFGPTQAEKSSKWGESAVGNFGEFWNAPYLEGSQYTFLPLKYSNGELSNMNLQLTHLDKRGSIKTNLNDVMFESYVYSEDINKVSSITLSNLLSGKYDLYLYGNLEDSNANYEIYKYPRNNFDGKAVFLGLKSTYINSDVNIKETLEEGVHYVVYKEIDFQEGDLLEIIVKSFDEQGERSNSFISGMQLVKSKTKLAYNISSNTKKLDCVDSDGGFNYDKPGKIYINGRYSSKDLCDNQNLYLNELSCEEGIKSIKIYECPNGCVDGFCIPDFKFEACNGCLYNQICKPKGTREDNKYCDEDKHIKLQKAERIACKKDFECITDSCVNGECETLDSIAEKELGTKYTLLRFLCIVSDFNSNYQKYGNCLRDSTSYLIE